MESERKICISIFISAKRCENAWEGREVDKKWKDIEITRSLYASAQLNGVANGYEHFMCENVDGNVSLILLKLEIFVPKIMNLIKCYNDYLSKVFTN